MALKIIFAGTPAFALPSLQTLHASSHTVVAVYTQPDRPAGRGKKITTSPIKDFAIQHGLPVFQPKNFKSKETVTQLQRLKADLMVVAAYGLILPKSVLEAPLLGCINVHASLLPRWRGAAPIQYAILEGDKKSGITLMQMNEGLDTGDILSTQGLEILETDTFKSLHDKLAPLGARALLELLPSVEKKQLKPIPQDERLATYASKIQKANAKIDWKKPAIEIDRQIRAFSPCPGAYSLFNHQTLRVFQSEVVSGTFTKPPGTIVLLHGEPVVITGENGLKLSMVQLPGKRKISGHDFVNAYFQNVAYSARALF